MRVNLYDTMRCVNVLIGVYYSSLTLFPACICLHVIYTVTVSAGDFVEVLTEVGMSFFHFVSYISEVDKRKH